MSEPLGPAVTDSFPKALGLHELVGAERSERVAAVPGGVQPPSPPAPPAEPQIPAVEFSPKLFLNALRLADKIASRLLKVEQEEAETLDELAGAIAPMVQHYAHGHSTVAALWGNLIVCLVGIVYGKAEKVQERVKLEKARDEARPPGGDGSG